MANKKFNALLSKAAIVTMLVSCVATPAFGVVGGTPTQGEFAKAGVSVGQPKDIVLAGKTKDMILNPDTYTYTAAAGSYKFSDFLSEYAANPTFTTTQLETKLVADKTPIVTALAVSSVSATSATTVKVVFNKAIDATKVVVTNFSILDKNNQPIAPVTGAVLSPDGKTVTLTTPALAATNAPYTLMVNPNAITLANQSLPITVATTAPTAVVVAVTNATTLTVGFDSAVADATDGGDIANGKHPALYFTVTDLTDSTQTPTVSGGVIDPSGELVLTTSALKAGHNYSVTIAKNTVIDAFGNKNVASTIDFSIQNNSTVPAITSVKYVQSKASPSHIDAIVTFNVPVVKVGGTVASVQDVSAYTTTPDGANNTLLDSTTITATQTAEVDGLALTGNQILVEYVNNGVTMLAGKQYGLVLPVNTVTDATIAAVQNASTSFIATNSVDVVAPTLKTVVLNSDTSATLTFSKSVSYDTSKAITLKGYKLADGSAAAVAATVAMSSDGTSATLTPASGYVFETSMAAADLTVASAAFTDAAKNPSAFANAVSATLTDSAAPVALIAKLTSTKDITVSFTEAVTPVATSQPTLSVNGNTITYKTGAKDTDNNAWDAAASALDIFNAGGTFATGNQVVVTAGAVKDAATVANTNATTAITVQ